MENMERMETDGNGCQKMCQLLMSHPGWPSGEVLKLEPVDETILQATDLALNLATFEALILIAFQCFSRCFCDIL